METISHPTHGIDLNENSEWAKAPLDDVIPAWLQESLNDNDEDIELTTVEPYLQDEFKEWLMDKRGISSKSADDYIRAYESAYESLYQIVELDLYDSLQLLLEELPELMQSDKSKAMAPGLVEIYVEAMLEEKGDDEDVYTNAELRALKTYHSFIVDVAGASDKTLTKEKSYSLPDEEEFLSWLETECRVDYENAKKMVSSVKRMDLILPSLVTEPMTFLDVLRALPAGSKRKNYLKLVSTKKREIYRNADCSYKTIQNGFANINYYLNFLNNNNKNVNK